MKIISTQIFTLFITVAATAQELQKGNILLGGTLGFSTQKIERTDLEDAKDNYIVFNPTIGKFYRNNRMAGINLFYSRDKTPSYETASNSYGFGVFLRQYLPLGKSFYLFAEEGASFNTMKSERNLAASGYQDKFKQTSLNLNLYPGISYLITKRIMAELALNNLVSFSYRKETRNQTYTNGSPESKAINTSFGLSTGFGQNNLGNLAFGLKWLLK